VEYARELERLKVTFEAGLEDREASYRSKIEVASAEYYQDIIAALGPVLVQRTLQKLLGSYKEQRPAESVRTCEAATMTLREQSRQALAQPWLQIQPMVSPRA